MVIFFRDKSVSAYFFLLVLCVAVHAHFFITAPQLMLVEDDGLLSLLLRRYIQPLQADFLFFIYLAVVVLQAIRFNFVLNEARMFQHNNTTTAMAYILLTAFIPQWCTITAALLANTFIIWIVIKLVRLYNHPSPKTQLFNTGLIVGVSILSYHPTAILIPVILFTLAVVRPFRLSEWMILLSGILLPFYFLFSGLYLTDHIAELPRFIPDVHPGIHFIQPDIWLWISLAGLFVLLLFGFAYWQSYNSRMVINIRKNWSVMLVMLLAMLPLPFVFSKAGIQSVITLLIPLSAFISCGYLYPKRTLLPNLLFLLAAAIIIHTNWVLIKN
ncbi:MAG: hypothetical protein KGO81_08335 [Bacteroidota bacterium]|nr:hypothetical protein [Bacteroidota bacterium]